MPAFFRKFWPYLALSALAVITAEPLTRAQMMCTDDAPFHLFRAVELGSLLELGHWLPRWAPHMAQGYGYPFFNFYAPLSSYAVVGLHWAGLAYPLALRAAFIVGLWLAGVAAFLFVRDLFGERAGVAAGAAYLLAPYLAYDVLYRGNLAEAWGFVWGPVVLLALRRLEERMKDEGGRMKNSLHPSAFILHPSLLYAALILTHNVFALIASPLIFGYAGLVAWQARGERWRVLAWGLVSLLAGVGLTAYFWLPALAERGLVHSDRLLVPPIFTWYTNFSSVRELLGPLPAFDERLINPSPARTIGWVTVVVGAVAVVGMILRWVRARGVEAGANLGPGQSSPPGPLSRRQKAKASAGRGGVTMPTVRVEGDASTVIFFTVALVGYCLLTLEVSRPVWGLIGPLELVQFPWRMLGPAALCAAVLVGASVAVVEGWLARWRGAGAWGGVVLALPAAVAVGAVFAGAAPAWNAIYCPSAPTADVGDLVVFEALSNTIGTTAKGEYLPRTVTRMPAENDLALALEQGVEPSRLQLPDGAEARVLSAAAGDPLDATFEIEAEAGVTATYRQFYYPGWRVAVDGEPVAVTASPEEGLITFEVPAGRHAVRVWFGGTGGRGVAIAVSVFTVVVLAAAVVVGRRQTTDDPQARQNFGADERRKTKDESQVRRQTLSEIEAGKDETATPVVAVLVLLAVCVGVVGAKWAGVDKVRGGEEGESLVAAQYPLGVEVAGGVRLYGYDLSATTIAGDGFIDVAWYAAMWEGSTRRWWPAVALEDEAGQAWSVLNPLPPRWHREPKDTPEWGPGQYAQWARHVTPLPGSPPGIYTLYGWVFDRDNLEIASVLDEAGNAVAPRLALETITLTRPRQPYALTPANVSEHAFGAISLLGYDLVKPAGAAGEAVPLALYWRSQAATAQDWRARVELLDSAGQPALSVEVEPANGYPTSQWLASDEWLGQHALRLPAALPAGEYTIAVSVPGAAEGRVNLATLRVTTPERRFEPLPFEAASGAAFGEVGVLEGYDLAASNGALRVALAWRATGSPLVGYSVFVHLADAAGRVWAQSDAAPAGWTRPTTGWVAGEYLRDEHNLALPGDLPAGEYTVWVGLYDPLTGERVAASGPGAAPPGDERMALTVVTLP